MVETPSSRLVYTVCELKWETIQRGGSRLRGRLMMGLCNQGDNVGGSLKSQRLTASKAKVEGTQLLP